MSVERIVRSAWAGPIFVAAVYALTAALALSLTRNTIGVATTWPPSGILLAGLAMLPAGATWRVLAAVTVASFGANLLAGTPVGLSAAFTAANVIEGWVAVSLLRRWCPHRPSFISPRDVRGFCGAAAVASLVSTACAALFAGGDVSMILSWFTTVLLGMLVVTPLLLIVAAVLDPASDEQGVKRHKGEVALLFAAIVAATGVAFGQAMLPLAFVPLIALLLASYRMGPIGAAAGVLVIAVVSSTLTTHGYGRLALLPPAHAALFLQFYFLMLFATSLPTAAVLTAKRQLAAQLAESERRYRLLADSSNDLMLLLSQNGRILYASPAAERLVGYTPDELVGQILLDFIHADDLAAATSAAERVLKGEEEIITYRQRRRDGSYAWLEAASRPVVTPRGQKVVASIRDVSQRRAAELAAAEARRRMQEANRMLTMAERAAGVGHWRIDFSGQSVFWSPQVFHLHGVSGFAPPTLADAINFYHEDDRLRVAEMVDSSLKTAKAFDFEARIVRADGEIRHVVSRGQPEVGYDGEPIGLFGTVQDVTRQVQVERELEHARQVAEAAAARAMHMADTDALTGVASRRKTLNALDDMIVKAEAAGEPLALAIFDIDHFKSVNDRFGHQAGDAVLIRVARIARESVRPTDLVGRLGGEEFVVLLPGATAAQAVTVAEELRGAIAEPPADPAAGPAVTTSIGLAVLTPGGTAATLLAEADAALYDAKAAGRNATRLAA